MRFIMFCRSMIRSLSESFQCMMDNQRRHPDVGYMEDTCFDTFFQNVTDDLRFALIKFFTGFLDPPNIAEERSPQCSVTEYDRLDRI